MRDGLIDLFNRRLELAARKIIVAPKARLELLHLGLKVRDVNILLTYYSKLLLIGKRVHGRVAQERNHRNKELRTNHVHLLVAIAHVHNTRVVELTLWLKQGN